MKRGPANIQQYVAHTAVLAVKRHAEALDKKYNEMKSYLIEEAEAQALERPESKLNRNQFTLIGHTMTINFCGCCMFPTEIGNLVICHKGPGECSAVCFDCLKTKSEEDHEMAKCMVCQKWTCWSCGINSCVEPTCSLKSICNDCTYKQECWCYDESLGKIFTCVKHITLHTQSCQKKNYGIKN